MADDPKAPITDRRELIEQAVGNPQQGLRELLHYQKYTESKGQKCCIASEILPPSDSTGKSTSALKREGFAALSIPVAITDFDVADADLSGVYADLQHLQGCESTLGLVYWNLRGPREFT